MTDKKRPQVSPGSLEKALLVSEPSAGSALSWRKLLSSPYMQTKPGPVDKTEQSPSEPFKSIRKRLLQPEAQSSADSCPSFVMRHLQALETKYFNKSGGGRANPIVSVDNPARETRTPIKPKEEAAEPILSAYKNAVQQRRAATAMKVRRRTEAKDAIKKNLRNDLLLGCPQPSSVNIKDIKTNLMRKLEEMEQLTARTLPSDTRVPPPHDVPAVKSALETEKVDEYSLVLSGEPPPQRRKTRNSQRAYKDMAKQLRLSQAHYVYTTVLDPR